MVVNMAAERVGQGAFYPGPSKAMKGLAGYKILDDLIQDCLSH